LTQELPRKYVVSEDATVVFTEKPNVEAIKAAGRLLDQQDVPTEGRLMHDGYQIHGWDLRPETGRPDERSL
jgi:hypothetical protein